MTTPADHIRRALDSLAALETDAPGRHESELRHDYPADMPAAEVTALAILELRERVAKLEEEAHRGPEPRVVQRRVEPAGDFAGLPVDDVERVIGPECFGGQDTPKSDTLIGIAARVQAEAVESLRSLHESEARRRSGPAHVPRFCPICDEASPWAWMDGADNDLDSMGADMVIRITARQLRALIADGRREGASDDYCDACGRTEFPKLERMRAVVREASQALIKEIGATGPEYIGDTVVRMVEALRAARATIARLERELGEVRLEAGSVVTYWRALERSIERARGLLDSELRRACERDAEGDRATVATHINALAALLAPREGAEGEG